MKILSYEGYLHINESVRSELFKNGMCVLYSDDGEHANYFHYIVLTEKEDIQKAIDDLNWPTTFSESDKTDILNDKYGVLVASRENGARYVCISDVLVNNILYIWDTKLKFSDMIKDGYIKDLFDKCTTKNLIYEKDVDFSKITTKHPEAPYYNYDWQPEDWSSLSRGYNAWSLDHSPNNPGSFRQPNPLFW